MERIEGTLESIGKLVSEVARAIDPPAFEKDYQKRFLFKCWQDDAAARALERARAAVAVILPHVLEPLFQGTPVWRCFHCDEVFINRHSAQLHFGYTECSEPACQIKAGAEGSMLEALRRAENDAERATAAMHNESSEGWVAYHNLASRVREQVEAAENLGYERGLADGHLRAIAPESGGAS